MNPVAWIDAGLAAFLPPLPRIVLWAIISAALSMGIYARISPQGKMAALKSLQKEARRALMRYDGEWAGLSAAIKTDLSLSLRQLSLTLLPFVAAVAPVLWLMMRLSELFDGDYLTFGPDWMRGFDFVYLGIALIVSLAIKMIFRIV